MITVGECCVALRSVMGASQKFETSLSHRGEEMGSIRGRIRIHVPKDRRTTRQKIYGGSTKSLLLWISALLALSLPTKPSSPLPLHSLTLPWASHRFLYLVPQWSAGLALHTCWYLSTASSFGSCPTDADQMHPEGLKQDMWVLGHQVRLNIHKHNFAVWLQTGIILLHASKIKFRGSFDHCKISFSLLLTLPFQTCSVLRKMIKVLKRDTCLLQQHGSQ